MPKAPVYNGPERRRRGVTPRLVLILFFLACAYMTAVFIVGEIRNHYWSEQRDASRAQITYSNALDSCERGRELRREMNDRARFHEQDAANLRALSRTLAGTRKAEAKFYREFARERGLGDRLAPLVNRLEQAAKDDLEIEGNQAAVTFTEFATPPCKQTVEKP